MVNQTTVSTVDAFIARISFYSSITLPAHIHFLSSMCYLDVRWMADTSLQRQPTIKYDAASEVLCGLVAEATSFDYSCTTLHYLDWATMPACDCDKVLNEHRKPHSLVAMHWMYRAFGEMHQQTTWIDCNRKQYIKCETGKKKNLFFSNALWPAHRDNILVSALCALFFDGSCIARQFRRFRVATKRLNGGLTAQPYVFASENKAKHEISWSLFSLLKN